MKIVFQTTNRAVAITLATCGVPFAKDEVSGADIPFVHIYDIAVIRAMKAPDGAPRFKGLPLEEAARRAFRAGLPGLLVYNFLRDELCERILKAYNAHSQALAGADAGGVPANLTLSTVEPEDAAILCAQFTKNRNIFTHGWKAVRPFLHLPGTSDQRTEAGKTVIVGSFRLVPLAV